MEKNTQKDRKKIKCPYKISEKRVKIAIVLFVSILAFVIILLSPLFDIDTIKIEGASIHSEEIIASTSGIKKGENLFRIDASKAKEKITSLGRIDNVTIKRVWPSKVVITIDEKIESGYIKEGSTYTAIDETGKILKTKSAIEYSAPVVLGIKVTDSYIGDYIKINSENSKEISDLLTRILTELKNQSILSNIKSVDLTKLDDIKMTLTTDTLVNMGEDSDEDGNNIEYKIAFLKAIIPELPKTQSGGVIELSDTKNVTSSMS